MYLLQYQKLHDRLEAVLVAHRLIGNMYIKDIYVSHQPYACDGKPGYNLFVDDFKWELSSIPGEWLRVILSSTSINGTDAKMIHNKLKEHDIKTFFLDKQVIFVFEVYLTDLNDEEIDAMAEVTDLYLSLKK